MRPPMRAGTAARLGLRVPSPRLRGPLPDPMSPEEFEAFKRRWRAEHGHVGQHWVKVLPRAPMVAPCAPTPDLREPDWKPFSYDALEVGPFPPGTYAGFDVPTEPHTIVLPVSRYRRYWWQWWRP